MLEMLTKKEKKLLHTLVFRSSSKYSTCVVPLLGGVAYHLQLIITSHLGVTEEI